MSSELRKVFDDLKKRFKAGAVGEKTTFYFSLGDGEDEKWSMTLSSTGCTIKKGKIENADCVLKTSAELFEKMVSGQYKPGIMDFMSGKVKSNDPTKLQLLKDAFGLGS